MHSNLVVNCDIVSWASSAHKLFFIRQAGRWADGRAGNDSHFLTCHILVLHRIVLHAWKRKFAHMSVCCLLDLRFAVCSHLSLLFTRSSICSKSGLLLGR